MNNNLKASHIKLIITVISLITAVISGFVAFTQFGVAQTKAGEVEEKIRIVEQLRASESELRASKLKLNEDLDKLSEDKDALNFSSFNAGLGFFIPVNEYLDFEVGYGYKYTSYEKLNSTSDSLNSHVNIGYLGLNIRF